MGTKTEQERVCLKSSRDLITVLQPIQSCCCGKCIPNLPLLHSVTLVHGPDTPTPCPFSQDRFIPDEYYTMIAAIHKHSPGATKLGSRHVGQAAFQPPLHQAALKATPLPPVASTTGGCRGQHCRALGLHHPARDVT